MGMTAGRVDDTTQETETEWSPEKKKRAFPWLIIAIPLIVIAVFLGVGGLIIKKGHEYKDATKEQCELTNYDSSTCTYDGSCSGTGSSKRCSTCYGVKYRYYAIAEAKCGTETVLQADSYGSCNSWPKSVGSSYTCYVPDCDEGEFSWSSGGTNMAIGIALVVIGCLACCCWCLCCGPVGSIKEYLGIGDDETNEREDGDNEL